MVVLDGRQPEMVAVSVALLVAATLSGFLRLLARHVMHAGFWWDDWCSLFALVSTAVIMEGRWYG